MLTDYLHVSDEVRAAGKRVVALESTIITHGMPYPQNVETALEVEQIVRDAGAVPATIALLEGKIHVGLTKEQLQQLGNNKDSMKASRRDLPALIAMKRTAGTTVAATMIAASIAGIQVFATGGIGGVHRGGHISMDVSADLYELAETSVAVVSAGAKAILDIPRTLEVLETLGVPVIGYRTDTFPEFYTSTGENKVDCRIDNLSDLAAVIQTKQDLQLKGGILIANPIPEDESLDRDFINAAIVQGISEAEKRGVKGKEVTPFLLSYLYQATDGTSLTANIALVKNNARLASQLVCKFK
ncbi:MAG: pseudouridine-5'-phosphate glycosidase [Chlamydiales bacterium]|nr:pseudouridine-5'-phosphate glycosidase [Chlamydiia bacterium]MCP5506757.1 pseudouridine-5'-phosphate glycosidase [Chlamydiales bacterium]